MTEFTRWERDLSVVLDRVSRLSAGYGRAYDARTLADSVRALDDEASRSLTIGNHVQYCLVQAVDMCEGIKTLLLNDEGLQIPLAASYPLARAAIESSSLALWLMRPPVRKDRVLRRLQIAEDELRFEKAFIKSMTGEGRTSQQASARRANAKDSKQIRSLMVRIASANQIDAEDYLGTLPGWVTIIEEAAGALDTKQQSLLVAAWRFTSGLTHPSSVRGILAHVFDPQDEGSNKGEVSGGIEWIASTTSIAETVTRKAIVEFAHSKQARDAA